MRFGSAQAAQIAVFNKEAGSTTRHVALAGKSASESAAVMMQSRDAVPKMPDPIAWMLGPLQMPR